MRRWTAMLAEPSISVKQDVVTLAIPATMMVSCSYCDPSCFRCSYCCCCCCSCCCCYEYILERASLVSSLGRSKRGRDGQQHEAMERNVRQGTHPGQVQQETEVLCRTCENRLKDNRAEVGSESSRVPPKETCPPGQGGATPQH